MTTIKPPGQIITSGPRGQASLLDAEARHPTDQWSPTTIPGVCQTPAYTSAVLDQYEPMSPQDREHRLNLRRQRGEQLRTTPVRCRFLLGAAAHDHAPDTALMDDQRAHLAALNRLEHVQIRVLAPTPAPTHQSGYILREGHVLIEGAGLLFTAPGEIELWRREWAGLWERSVALEDYQQGHR